MSFLFPLGLLALLSLPVIIVLHLLNEQRRRMKVPSLLLWQSVPRRFEGERSRRLPLTWLLLLHLLAAGLLAFALGRPQIPGALSAEARHTAVVIDTSSSMAADDGGATRFERALQHARGLLGGLGPGDRATVIAAGRQASIVASGGAGDSASLVAAAEQLQPGGTGTDLEAALTLAEASLDPQLSRRIVVLTDGALPQQQPRDVAAPVEWAQIGGDRPNRAITAFATRGWGGNLQVYARVANFGNQPFVGTARLFAGEQEVSADTLSVDAGGETELTWTVPNSSAALRLELDGGDVLPLDDAAYIGVARARLLNVLLVSGQPAALERALGAVGGLQTTTVAPANYAAAQAEREQADLTIFDGYLPPEWPAGAALAIGPPPGNPLLPVSGDSIQLGERALRQRGGVVEGLSLSGVSFGSAQVPDAVPWAETLLSADEVPLIMRGQLDGREVAIWTFDLAAGNLPTRLAFPLLVSRTIRDLAPAQLPTAIEAGETVTLRPDPRASAVRLVGIDGIAATVPATVSVTLEGLTQPGIYRVEEQRGEEFVLAGLVGVNAGASGESNLAPRPAPELRTPASAPGGAPQRLSADIWHWLALGALGVLALEWIYVLLRGARRKTGGRQGSRASAKGA